MQVILDTNGLVVRVRNGAFLVEGKAGKRLISPHTIEGIVVHADCLLSSAAIRLALAQRVPIVFLDEVGGAAGRLWSAQFDRLPQVRRNQVLFETDRAAAAVWAADLYRLKAESQCALLRQRVPTHASVNAVTALLPAFAAESWQAVVDFEPKIMALEAQVARAYWEGVSACLPPIFGFRKRTRQPAQDLFNAALNYLYGMLYNTVEGATFAAGLDPYLGIVHADEYNKPTLVFDLIEPFRGWVDDLLIGLCLDGQLEGRHADPLGEGWVLNQAGRRLLIPAYIALLGSERPWQGDTASARQHIYQFTRRFSAFLEKYQPRTLSL